MTVRDQSTPYDAGVEPSELEMKILDLLEEADIDTETNDRICELVRKAQQRRHEAENPEPVDEGDVDDGPVP